MTQLFNPAIKLRSTQPDVYMPDTFTRQGESADAQIGLIRLFAYVSS
jgi:hypothetical protein